MVQEQVNFLHLLYQCEFVPLPAPPQVRFCRSNTLWY